MPGHLPSNGWIWFRHMAADASAYAGTLSPVRPTRLEVFLHLSIGLDMSPVNPGAIGVSSASSPSESPSAAPTDIRQQPSPRLDPASLASSPSAVDAPGNVPSASSWRLIRRSGSAVGEIAGDHRGGNVLQPEETFDEGMLIDLTAEAEAAKVFAPSRQASGDNFEQIAEQTVLHYDLLAYSYDPHDYDLGENITAFLGHIQADRPFKILDLGCGPGRALKTFKELGHNPTGLDGAQNFVKMAHENSGCEVLHQNLLALELSPHHFDGVFANASLYHVPKQALPQVLQRLHATLKPGGVLFSFNPLGTGYEGWFDNQRYGVFHHLAAWCRYMNDAGFIELKHYDYEGPPPERQKWLASVWHTAPGNEPA